MSSFPMVRTILLPAWFFICQTSQDHSIQKKPDWKKDGKRPFENQTQKVPESDLLNTGQSGFHVF